MGVIAVLLAIPTFAKMVRDLEAERAWAVYQMEDWAEPLDRIGYDYAALRTGSLLQSRSRKAPANFWRTRDVC